MTTRLGEMPAEDKAHDVAEDYRAIFEATGDGVIISDMEGNLVEVNPALCRMHGYTCEEMHRLYPTDFIHPSYHGVFAEYMASLNDGRGYRTAALDVRKDGSAFPVEVNGTLFTYRGRPHVLGVVRDISDRVMAEEQLREREEQYRSIFESTMDAITICDREGNIVEANPAFCAGCGYTRAELVTMSTSDLVPPIALEGYRTFLQTVHGGGVYRGQGAVLTKDGRILQTDVVGTQLIYKGTPHILLVARDITEQEQAEAQLREREEQYRGIFEASNDAIIITDFEGNCVEANPAACKMYGYPYEEMIKTNAAQATHPEYHDLARRFMETVRAGGTIEAQAVNVRKDGSTFVIEARASQFTYRGRPHILTVSRDITERVRARELLEQRVEERTRELSTLLEVSQNLTSTLDLRPLLAVILEHLQTLIGATEMRIYLVDEGQAQLIARQGYTPVAGDGSVPTWTPFSLDQSGPIWDRLYGGLPVVVDDVVGDGDLSREFRRLNQHAIGHLQERIRSCLIVPLMIKGRVVGTMNLYHREIAQYTHHHAELARAVAQQAAIAIENARLYEQARELAVLEERQRLSRELHDSVSQALYSIALGAKTAHALLHRDPASVEEPLDFVLAQAERGLAEMRALIFELRPEALEQEGLVQALSKQAAVLHARHRLVVDTTLPSEPETSLPVKEALYRITQEALQNIVKHAHATHVRVTLAQSDDELVLEVRDNGQGFDPRDDFPGHLGLISMRERAERVGGTLEVESASATGTTVRVHVPQRVATGATLHDQM